MDILKKELHSLNALLAEFLVTLFFSILGIALIGLILLAVVAFIASAVTIFKEKVKDD